MLYVFWQTEAVITDCSFKQYEKRTFGVGVTKARGRKGRHLFSA